MTEPKRFHTAPGGRFAMRRAVPFTASDELLAHLQQLLDAQGGVNFASATKQFRAEGFTDHDLVLGPACSLSTCGTLWIDAVLAWDPNATEPQTFRFSAPTPSIADRLIVYLYVLGLWNHEADRTHFPGVQVIAQQRLSQMLLEHPVLLHPRVRVEMRGHSSSLVAGVCSVAHAIAMCRNAHFPMVRDWPAGQAPLERLRELSNNSLLAVGLTTKAPQVARDLEGCRGTTPLGFALKKSENRPLLLASLYELGRAANREGSSMPDLGIFLADFRNLVPRELNIDPLSVTAVSLLGACGLITKARMTPDEARATRIPEFIALVAAQDEWSRSNMVQRISNRYCQAIFSDGIDSYSTEQVRYNLETLEQSVVDSGLLPSARLFAQLGVDRLRSVGTPDTSVSGALGFLQHMQARGIPAEDAITALTESMMDADASAAYPGWLEAYRIHEAERTMTEVLDRAVQAAPPRRPAQRRARQGL